MNLTLGDPVIIFFRAKKIAFELFSLSRCIAGFILHNVVHVVSVVRSHPNFPCFDDISDTAPIGVWTLVFQCLVGYGITQQ